MGFQYLMSTALVCLNVMHTGPTEPTGHCGCSPGHSGHFGGSHVMIHDNTKLRKFSKIGLWSYFEGPYGHGHEGLICPSGTSAGFNQWSEGSLEPPSLWVYHVRRQNAQNTVFCKLIIIVYFNGNWMIKEFTFCYIYIHDEWWLMTMTAETTGELLAGTSAKEVKILRYLC